MDELEAESFRVYHLLLCKSSQEMPDTGGRPNACYSASSQFLLLFFFLLFISAVLSSVFPGHVLNYTLNSRAPRQAEV